MSFYLNLRIFAFDIHVPIFMLYLIPLDFPTIRCTTMEAGNAHYYYLSGYAFSSPKIVAVGDQTVNQPNSWEPMRSQRVLSHNIVVSTQFVRVIVHWSRVNDPRR